MSLKSIFPFLLLGGLYAAGRRAKSLSFIDYAFGVPDLRATRYDAVSLSLVTQLPVRFDNASPQQASWKGVYLKLVTPDGTSAGNMILPAATVARLSQSVVKAEVRVPLSQLVKNGYNILVMKKLTLTAKGTVQTSAGNVLIDQAFDLTLPAVPDLVKRLLGL